MVVPYLRTNQATLQTLRSGDDHDPHEAGAGIRTCCQQEGKFKCFSDRCNALISLVPEVGLEPTRRLDPRGILSPVRLPIPPLRHQRFGKGLTSALQAILFMFCREPLQPTRTLPYGETHPVSRDACAKPPPLISVSLPFSEKRQFVKSSFPTRALPNAEVLYGMPQSSIEDQKHTACDGAALPRISPIR